MSTSLIIQTVATNIAVGSHVWVEDLDEAWLDGVVVEVNGEEIKVNCTSGKTVSISWDVLCNLIKSSRPSYYLAWVVCTQDIRGKCAVYMIQFISLKWGLLLIEWTQIILFSTEQATIQRNFFFFYYFFFFFLELKVQLSAKELQLSTREASWITKYILFLGFKVSYSRLFPKNILPPFSIFIFNFLHSYHIILL